MDGDDNSSALCDIGAYELAPFGDPDSPLGTNMGAVFDWTTQIPFVDAFKMARVWSPNCVEGIPNSVCQDALEELQDEDGWITELPTDEITSVETILLNGDAGGDNFLEGEYLVRYQGSGTITYNPWEVAILEEGSDDEGGFQRILVENQFSDEHVPHLQVTINTSDPADPAGHLRNIRFFKVEYDDTYETQPFNPAFLDKVKNYRVLRFMDWMRTNGIPINDELTLVPTGEWAQRAQVDDYTYTGQNGVPLEAMLALSNQTRIAPWFNMPHLADDEYMAEFATMVRNNLDDDLQVYIEYSNETWNPTFSAQFSHVREEGTDAFDPDTPWVSALNYHGMRAAQMCRIWHEAWGAEADRIVCIAASQASNGESAEHVLACPLWMSFPEMQNQISCADYGGFDALAVAPYFGNYIGTAAFATQIEGWLAEPDGGLNSLFNEIQQVALPMAYDNIEANALAATGHDVELIAYEGGQHLDVVSIPGQLGADAAELFELANRHPLMGFYYGLYLEEWHDEGGCLFANYTLVQNLYGPNGSWGILEYINQANSYKYQAVMDFIDDFPWPWAEYGCSAGQTSSFSQFLSAIFKTIVSPFHTCDRRICLRLL